MIIELQNKNAELELDKAALQSMVRKYESDEFFPSETEILKESDFRVIEGAEPNSWAGGARWMKRKFLEKTIQCNDNQ